jgi:hypothetical protein
MKHLLMGAIGLSGLLFKFSKGIVAQYYGHEKANLHIKKFVIL